MSFRCLLYLKFASCECIVAKDYYAMVQQKAAIPTLLILLFVL